MKIFIEGSPLLKERTGIGQYTKRLVEAMALSHPEHSYTIFGFKFWTRPLPEFPFAKNTNIHSRIIRFIPGRGYNLLFKLGLVPPVDLLLMRRPDIVFFPNFVRWPVFRRKAKSVVVVHDLSFIYFSQYTHPKNLPYMQKYVPKSIKNASHIITISKSSKKQIAEYYKVDPKKISIVVPAVDHEEYKPRSSKEVADIRKKYNLPSRYLLYASTLEPRKNVVGILEAYEALDPKTKAAYGLVLAGGKGWHDEPILESIDKLRKAGENIITTGYVPDEDLPAIYSGASVFLYPSFYEGFGIPLLEAMACGVPVISADNTSLPEVVGDAGLYVDAKDTAGLTSSIQKILSDNTLAEGLRQKGFAQADKFTWERSAEIANGVFEKLLS